jgi:hypothetical protein
MAQAVSRRFATAEARVRSQGGPCEICGGQSGTGTVFLRVLRWSISSGGWTIGLLAAAVPQRHRKKISYCRNTAHQPAASSLPIHERNTDVSSFRNSVELSVFLSIPYPYFSDLCRSVGKWWPPVLHVLCLVLVHELVDCGVI